jgi:hypothetical protein
MSSVGFTPTSREQELDKLREAYDSLKDVIRGIDGARHCLDALNFGMARAHLNAAEWHYQQAKKAIAVVGQAKNQKSKP